MNDRTKSDFSDATAFSDSRMDGLLRDFFRLETPTNWNLPGPRRSNSALIAPPTSMTILASQSARSSAGSSAPRGLVMAGTLTVLALSLVLMVSGQPQNFASSAANAKLQQDNVSAAPQMMLVSPKGDSASSEKPVSDDGLLLKEADQIQLNPKR